jgi:VPDSG-CTERM motif
MRTWVTALGVSIIALAFANSGSSITMTSVDGNWMNVVGDPTPVLQSVSIGYGNGTEDQVRWGDPAGWFSCDRSGLGFTGAGTPQTFATEQAFEIGQLRHFNYPVYNAASAADLQLSMAFSDPAGLNGMFQFTFAVNETANNYWPTDNPLNDDFISFPSSFSSETITIGGITYTLRLLGFGSNPDNLVSQFRSSEGDVNSTLLWGKITTEMPVGVPDGGTTLVLLGLAMMALFTIKQQHNVCR